MYVGVDVVGSRITAGEDPGHRDCCIVNALQGDAHLNPVSQLP